MKITWFGTASIAIESGNDKVLFDPFIPLKGSSVDTTYKDFEEYEDIVITHGHIDHISSIPRLFEKHMRIYSTQTPAETLVNSGIPKDHITLIFPKETFCIGDIRITAYHGKHIRFDKKLVKQTIRRSLTHRLKQALKLGKSLEMYPENGEILCYLIKAEGKRIFLMGSLGLDSETIYPKDIDLLILPYQGKSELTETAMDIIVKLKPKKVFLNHFDDTFPPVSQNVNTKDLENILKGVLPLNVPEHKHAYEF